MKPMRGALRRRDRAMSPEEVEAFLKEQRVARVASRDPGDWLHLRRCSRDQS